MGLDSQIKLLQNEVTEMRTNFIDEQTKYSQFQMEVQMQDEM